MEVSMERIPKGWMFTLGREGGLFFTVGRRIA